MRSDIHIAPIPGTHLTDDQLLESYALAADNVHINGCRRCAARYEELASTFEHVREDAVREADLAFSPERLHDQRDRIMRRLERHDHPAEVVAFPLRPAAHPVSVQRMFGPARRWVAAAAASGLAAGMFLGFAMDRSTHYAAMNEAARQAAARPSLALQVADSDDQFFLEVDRALIGSRVRDMQPDLGAIDLMTTPVEIREVGYVRE